MTSERRTAANRANACRSTGPKSAEGKRAVRFNGIRHGLLAREVVLPGEDPDAFEDFRNSVHADLAPSGRVETLLVDRMVNAAWRLQRLQRVETALFHWRTYVIKAEGLSAEVRNYEKTTHSFELASLDVCETVITNKASHSRATKMLSQAQCERERDEVLLGRTLDADARKGDAFGKLARYEATIERSFYRALHELQRLQAARHGGPVPLPQAVDMSVSIFTQE